jgi:hypothetical protein
MNAAKIALDAARQVEDLFAQHHNSVNQRLSHVQMVINRAIVQALQECGYPKTSALQADQADNCCGDFRPREINDLEDFSGVNLRTRRGGFRL